jgi:hypothetical protein
LQEEEKPKAGAKRGQAGGKKGGAAAGKEKQPRRKIVYDEVRN